MNGYDGDEVVSLYPDAGIGITASTVNGGAGVNTLVFPTWPLSQVTVVYGGVGNQNVILPAFSAGLTSVSMMQLIDGSVYGTNAAPGAQAALMFKGIFGRIPNTINAGGVVLRHFTQQLRHGADPPLVTVRGVAVDA